MIIVTSFLLSTLLVGVLIFRAVSGRSPNQQGYWTLAAGAGLPIGLTVVTKSTELLNEFELSLELTAHTLLGGMIVLLFLTSALRHFKTFSTGSTQRTAASKVVSGSFVTSANARTTKPFSLYVGYGLLLLIGVHLVLTLSNNWIRPIFPWDAFTTWMYRAKIWVLSDSLLALHHTPEWIEQGGSTGFALYANHYPVALSAYPALMSALHGGWHAVAASLPWTAAFLALGLGMFGLVRKLGYEADLGLIAAYCLSSLPLLGAHAALAGYGDIWMALTSGMGLALLLGWRLSRAPASYRLSRNSTQGTHRSWLAPALLLLITGTQLKTEGWLWLMIGLLFIAFELMSRWLRYRWTICLLATLAMLFWMLDIQMVSLDSFGQWGISDSKLYAGPFGEYALRPYNPLKKYFVSVLQDPNFHGLGVACTLGLIALTVNSPLIAAPIWLMLLLIAGSQGIIFGLSAYSEYAETGTAINRLLLHFSPLFVLIGVLALHQAINAARGLPKIGARQITAGIAIASGLLIITFAATVWSSSQGHKSTTQYDAANMSAVLGKVRETPEGIQFDESLAPVGVLAVKATLTAREQTRFVYTDATSITEKPTRFYWINADAPEVVNSLPIIGSGLTVLDMREATEWRQTNVREFGFIVPSDAFSNVKLKSITFSQQLAAGDLPLAIAQWFTTSRPVQSSLNMLLEPAGAFPSFAELINVALLVSLLMAALGALFKSKVGYFIPTGLIAFGALWIISDLRWLSHLNDWRSAAGALKQEGGVIDYHSGDHLLPTQRFLFNYLATTDSAGSGDVMRDFHQNGRAGIATESQSILLIPASEADSFEVQRLPFLLLPYRSAFVTQSEQIDPSMWPGEIVVVGKSAFELDRTTATLIRRAKGQFEAAVPGPFVRVLSRSGTVNDSDHYLP